MKLAIVLSVVLAAGVLVWVLAAGGGEGGGGAVAPRPRDAASSQPAVEVDAGELRVPPASARPRGEARESAGFLGKLMGRGKEQPGEQARVGARVVSAEGRAVEGAWLRVPELAEDVAWADERGRIELALPLDALESHLREQHNRTLVAEVGASGFVTHRIAQPVTADARSVGLGEVLLARGAILYGRVVDTTGLGVEGALVVHEPMGGWLGSLNPDARRGPQVLRGWVPTQPILRVTSGPGGAFRLEGIAPGHGLVWARGETTLWALSEPIGVRAGEEPDEVVLVLHDAMERTITGTVVDPGGRAVPHLHLRVAYRGEGISDVVVTDARGRFHHVPPEGQMSYFTAASPSWEWEELRASDVSPGTHELVLRFRASEWLWLAVRDAAGQPITNGRALALKEKGADDERFVRGETTFGSDGRGRLRKPAEPLRVRVESPGYRNALLGPFEPDSFPDPLVVTLAPLPAITGRVLRADGSPAVGARVALHTAAAAGSAQPRFTFKAWAGSGEPFVQHARGVPAESAVADGAGRFRLKIPGSDARAEAEEEPDFPPAVRQHLAAREARSAAEMARNPPSYYVVATLGGEAAAVAGPLALDVEDGLELDLAMPRGGAIAGELVLVGGGSPAGWIARASDGLARIVEAPVAEDGGFRLEHLHPGSWQVRAFEPGARFYPAALSSPTDRPAEPDVRVEAGRTSSLVLRAAAPPKTRLLGRVLVDGAPPGAWAVTVISFASMDPWQRASLDPDGRFEVTVSAGSPAMVQLGPGAGPLISFGRIEAELETHAGEQEWTLELATASLHVRVDPARIPSESLVPSYLRVELDGAIAGCTLELDEQGHFGPATVLAGRATLYAPRAYNDAPTVLAELELAPGERRELDLH